MKTNSNWLSNTSGSVKHDVKGDLFEITAGNKSDLVKGKVNVAWDGAEVKVHGGAVSDTFVGAKHETLVGAKVSLNASKEVSKNALSRDRRASGHIYYGSSAYIKLEGPGAEMKLDSDAAELKAGSSYVIVENGGSVMVKAASDIELVAGGDIHLKGGNIILNGKVVGKKSVENPSIKAK